jgi:GNAT superfamily N-acetyltransferase
MQTNGTGKKIGDGPGTQAHPRFYDAGPETKSRIGQEWGELFARHMHIDDGFAIIAMIDDQPVGLISVYWRALPAPLPNTFEGYIDIIEVREGHRRRGIARTLVEMAARRASEKGAYQLRAWSSDDKIEAIPMWKALDFGLCPATVYPKGQEVHGYFVVKTL